MSALWRWLPWLLMQGDSALSYSGPSDSGSGSAAGEMLGAVETGLRGWVHGMTGLGSEAQRNLILSILAIALIYILRRVALRIVDLRVDDPSVLYQWSKSSSQLAFVLSLILVFTVWLEGLRTLGTFLGLLSAGVAIALKDVVASLAGWGFILWRRPFRLGDRIQIGPRAGDVVDIRIFQFSLLEIGNWVNADQSTGRIVHVPNALVFTEPLSNYTAQFDFIWNELAVPLTFESDWKRAKIILQRIVDEEMGGVVAEAEEAVKNASRKYLIHFRKLTPKVYTSVEDSGVLLTLRFICPTRQRRGRAESLWEAILEAFAREPDIAFAYPTTRMYHNFLEGKEGARAPLPAGLGGERAPRGGE